MRRWLFNFAAAVSLVLCLATVALWAGTMRQTWTIWKWGSEPKPHVARMGGGEIVIEHYPPPIPFSGDSNEVIGSLMSQPWIVERKIRLVPLAAVFFAVPTAWLASFVYSRQRRRSLRGVCTKCNYNLTGNTSGVCPECGTPVVPKAGAGT